MYTLAKELNISPMECMKMPVSLVVELLCVHGEVEAFKADTLETEAGKMKQDLKVPRR